MGDEDHLSPGLLYHTQGLHHIPSGTGVGNEQDHVLGGHKAGRHDLHVAVPGGTELIGDTGKPGADLVCHHHAAALTHAVHLLCLPQQCHCLVHCLRRQGVLGAVDGGHKKSRCVLAEGGGVGIRAGCLLIYQYPGSVGLGQCNAHFMVAFKPQRPAEPEHRSLCHLAFPCQG